MVISVKIGSESACDYLFFGALKVPGSAPVYWIRAKGSWRTWHGRKTIIRYINGESLSPGGPAEAADTKVVGHLLLDTQ